MTSGLPAIAIYGGGGLGREIACLIADINADTPSWDLKGFYDDAKSQDDMIDGLPVLGGLDALNGAASVMNLVIGISDPQTKRKLALAITNKNISFPSLIHPSCIRGNLKFNKVAQGVIVNAGVIMTTHVDLKQFVLINLATTIGHDVTIGEFSSIMPGCSISGNVTIGAGSNVGTGARILQNITIGERAIVGAGAVVIRDAAPDAKLIGVPAINVLENVERV